MCSALKLVCVCCLIRWISSSPNIILIVTDDQDNLKGMHPMSKTMELIGRNGVSFPNTFVSTPLCCPSRSSILTGLYQHNHDTYNNSLSGGCYSAHWRRHVETRTFVNYLRAINYVTFYAGKYLNEYGKDHSMSNTAQMPTGWDWWAALQGNSVYYDYNLSINGTWHHYGHNETSDYLTTVISNMALDFISSGRERPFFMMLAPPAPHSPRTPERKYKSLFKNESALRSPNFNVPVGKDKHWLMRQSPSPLRHNEVMFVDEVYRERSRTLLSVDDMVTNITTLLRERNIWNNTYILFTSDHGYHLGQFSMPTDKRLPYESDIRVPLLIRGPGLPQNVTINDTVMNIDLAPTILEMAGLKPPQWMDGQSLLPRLRGRGAVTRERFLVEYRGEGAAHTSPGCEARGSQVANCVAEFDCKCQDSRNNTYSCLRELSSRKNTLFCQFHDAENYTEFYNLKTDPYQLHNLYWRSCSKVHREANFQALDYFKVCSGASCHRLGA